VTLISSPVNTYGDIWNDAKNRFEILEFMHVKREIIEIFGILWPKLANLFS